MLKHPVYSARRPVSEPPFEPRRTALLVVDVQRFVADPDYGYGQMAKAQGAFEQMAPYYDRVRRILPRIRALQDACRHHGVEVLFVRIEANTRDGRDAMPAYRLSGMLIPKGSPEGEVLPEVAPQGDEILLNKVSSSAFSTTAIDQILRNLGIDRLIVAGIATHGCVELTVRDAEERGYWVYLATDACTAATEELHASAVAKMDKGMIRIKTTEELLALIESVAFERRPGETAGDQDSTRLASIER